MEKNTTFTQGKILQPLILFALPVLFALFLQAMYGAVDLLIVGKFAASADVSAVSTGSQIVMTLTNLVSSFAMGTTILLGQQISAAAKGRKAAARLAQRCVPFSAESRTARACALLRSGRAVYKGCCWRQRLFTGCFKRRHHSSIERVG